jgi:hypothetical protein
MPGNTVTSTRQARSYGDREVEWACEGQSWHNFDERGTEGASARVAGADRAKLDPGRLRRCWHVQPSDEFRRPFEHARLSCVTILLHEEHVSGWLVLLAVCQSVRPRGASRGGPVASRGRGVHVVPL